MAEAERGGAVLAAMKIEQSETLPRLAPHLVVLGLLRARVQVRALTLGRARLDLGALRDET